MRLQLIGAAAALLTLVVLPAPATADRPTFEALSRTALYQDSDKTTIFTTTTGATTTINDRFVVSARYLVDVVSSASVDVVTQATGRFEDVRHEFSAVTGYKDSSRSITASYSYSTENDWKSHNPGLAFTHDFLSHNLTLGGGLQYQHNDITRSHSIGFERQLDGYLANLSATYTLTPRDLVGLAVTASFFDGFQSSPYRYIFVNGQAVLESYPEQRWKEAVVLRENHYFRGGWALRSHLRIYSDTYGVHALTLGFEGVLDRPPFELGVSLRGYGQTGASFYRQKYSAAQEFMSIDKEMSKFEDVFASLSAGYTTSRVGPFETIRLDVRASGFYFHYADFAALTSRYGLVSDVGIYALF